MGRPFRRRWARGRWRHCLWLTGLAVLLGRGPDIRRRASGMGRGVLQNASWRDQNQDLHHDNWCAAGRTLRTAAGFTAVAATIHFHRQIGLWIWFRSRVPPSAWRARQMEKTVVAPRAGLRGSFWEPGSGSRPRPGNSLAVEKLRLDLDGDCASICGRGPVRP